MDPEDLVGTQLGPYAVVRHIARGGMADVYLAHDKGLGRQVALKVLLPLFAMQTEFKTRFTREAQTTANLQHPNIIRIYSTGLAPGDLPYIAMEFCQRGTLADWLQQLSREQKILRTEQALAIVRQIADALQVAHEADLVHRDIKPSNILIREDGTPILGDLGIAAVTTATRLTRTGALLGTPQYMSPEQASGGKIDGRSDIYSLGIILYELLSGRRPFDAESDVAILHQHLHKEPMSLERIRSGLPAVTYRVVETCLRKKPGERYQSAAELVKALDRALAAEGASAWTAGVGAWHVPPIDRDLPGRSDVLRKPTTRLIERLKQQPSWMYAVGAFVLILLLFGLSELSTGEGSTNTPSAQIAEATAGSWASVVIIASPTTEQPTATIAPTLTSMVESPTDTPISDPPTDTPIPIPPTDTPIPDPPTDTPIPISPTDTPIPIPPTDTPSPSPMPVTCNRSPLQAFASIYNADSAALGCPVNGGQSGVSMAVEDFQGGRMLWRGDNRMIYVLYNSGQWAQYNDTWREGEPAFTCGGPDSPPDPRRGFGRVWCTHDVVRQNLGPAVNAEWPETGTTQDFETGHIIRLSNGRTYILYGSGRWRS